MRLKFLTLSFLLALLSIFMALPVFPAESEEPPNFIVGGGINLNTQSDPAFSGNFFFSKKKDPANYLVTFVDVFPEFRNGKLDIYTSTINICYARNTFRGLWLLGGFGPSFGGEDKDIAATFGGVRPFPLKKPLLLVPNLRGLYNNASGNLGLIVGFDLAIGSE